LSKGRILIVDDEPEVAAILADSLTPMGFDCTLADGGEAALALIGAGSFDAVFSDVRMPGMDGLTLFDRIAAGWPALASRFVFISGDVLHRDVMALAAKGRPIIEKPFNAGAVREAALAIVAQGAEA
jgi:CheY-like chemotaxis protein